MIIDLEEVYDKLSRKVMRWVLEQTPCKYIEVIEYIYSGAELSLGIIGGQTSAFQITAGLLYVLSI